MQLIFISTSIVGTVCGESSSLVHTFYAEILTCLAGLIIVYIKEIHIKELKRSFCDWKKTQLISNYYKEFTDNISFQTCTLKNNKCVLFNKEYLHNFNLFSNNTKNIEENSIDYLKLFNCINSNNIHTSIYDYISICKNDENNNERFTHIGQFKYTDKYYKVSIRKFNAFNQTLIDILIDDFTSLKEAELVSSETKIKQKLFSKFAHEFKTPLLIIKSLAQDFISNNSKTSMISLCNDISFMSDYISFLINDIIYYTSKDSVVNESNEIIDSEYLKELLEFCENGCKSLISIYSKKSVFVRGILNIPNNFNFSFYSNKTKLKQILLNLISNSVKFTRNGNITIEFRFMGKDAEFNKNYSEINEINYNEENTLELIVKDTGIGINPEQLEKILNIYC